MDEIKNTEDEIQFYRKLLMETIKISKDWQKTISRIIIALSIVLIFGIIGCSIVCEMYFSYAYGPKHNTSTNTNTNINKNTN